MTFSIANGAPDVTRAKARYIMIGGFLGAGKTTAVLRLAKRLSGQGLRVGLITNDQGQNLVDTALLRAEGFATEEIAGGCFCCRFNSLLDAAKSLTEKTRPDVFIAEPVGSCTDLVATVTYPLRRLYGQDFSIAPVSVLVDPIRAERVFGLESGRNFSEKVLYVYHKQIEEADVLVISKSDLLDDERAARLRGAVLAKYPGKVLLTASARNGAGLEEWFSRIAREEQPSGTAMKIDYQVYAEGEALLGWLNCAVNVRAESAFDANALLDSLALSIQQTLAVQDAEIAHLKMTFSPRGGLGHIAVVNLVRNDFVPELGLKLEDLVDEGQLVINLRAEADPELLEAATRSALAEAGGAIPRRRIVVEDLERFRPGKPTPTHRCEKG